MPRRIHQVKLISLTVFGLIIKPNGLGFDGNTALFFNIHGIKHLLGHLTAFQPAAIFNHSVGKGGFSMVNMCNNGKISD